MSDLEIYAQTLIHASSSDESVTMDEKPEFIDWVNKSNKKAKEMMYGCVN